MTLTSRLSTLVYKSSLQRRISRIESALEIPKDERSTFEVLLAKSDQRTMEGERLDDPTIGKKSIWRASDADEVSVEGLALEQYVKEGWKGYVALALPLCRVLLTENLQQISL